MFCFVLSGRSVRLGKVEVDKEGVGELGEGRVDTSVTLGGALVILAIQCSTANLLTRRAVAITALKETIIRYHLSFSKGRGTQLYKHVAVPQVPIRYFLNHIILSHKKSDEIAD